MKFSRTFSTLSVLTTLIICPTSYGRPLSDPFLQEWDFYNGITTYKLIISPSAAPGQDYHILYTFNGGDSSTDMCRAISNVSFQCQTGETVTRDDSQHLVRLNDRGIEYVYYDPKHMPPTSSIVGKWSYQYKNHYTNSVYTFVINITSGNSDKEYNINTSLSSSDNSGECSNDIFDTYQVINNPDGTLQFDRGSRFLGYHFLLDPKKMQITSADPSQPFSAGICINIDPMVAIPVFTKE